MCTGVGMEGALWNHILRADILTVQAFALLLANIALPVCHNLQVSTSLYAFRYVVSVYVCVYVCVSVFVHVCMRVHLF